MQQGREARRDPRFRALAVVELDRLAALPASGFQALQAESERAGLGFLRRLADEWASGANRFDRPGEMLLGARIGDELIAVGGLNVDPYATRPGVGRVRHVYVLSAYRSLGIGRRLVAEIVAAAGGRFDSLRLSTSNPAAARLYDGLGFHPLQNDAHCTHVLELGTQA
jgi:ribosomal protein S18 acetylase RimI-like enzyme